MGLIRGEAQVEFLRAVFARGGRIAEARFSLQRGVLKHSDPMYWVTLEQAKALSLQELAWTAALETYLLFEARQRMSKLEDEQERFAAILLNNLRSVERAHDGERMARAAFVEVLHHEPALGAAALLEQVERDPVDATNRRYEDCVELVRNSMSGLRRSALTFLAYDEDTVARLMRASIAIVLDELFHFAAAEQLVPKPR